jgi:hypothetical protein
MTGGIAVTPGVVGNQGFAAVEELDQGFVHVGWVEDTRFSSCMPASDRIISAPSGPRACGNAGVC